MSTKFFTQSKCDRCGTKLDVRIMSWFNSDTICMACSKAERELKSVLQAQGTDPRSYEGCGYLPTVDMVAAGMAVSK